jgi:hypothetical protein
MMHLKSDALIRPPRSRIVVLHVQHSSCNPALAQPLQARKRDLRADGL